MEVIQIKIEEYNKLLNRMDEIAASLAEKQKNPKEIFVDNQEFLQIMNISKRTAQTWRDEGIITFSQVGHKIYYSMKAINELLEKHTITAFNPSKK